MLATVTAFVIHDDKEFVEVVNDDGDIINVGHEVWENLRYTLSPDTNEIVQEVEGTFSQYPLQAAWAVTIHKAQGLTFDRVAIDAADAFAFGQVYVALSRCRSLDGLFLTSRLSAAVAFDDVAVSRFVSSQPSFEQTCEAEPYYQQQYRIEKLMELFGIDDIMHHADRLASQYSKLRNLYPDNVARMHALLNTLVDLQAVSERFKSQLMRLDNDAQDARAQQGAGYYLSQLQLFGQSLTALLAVEVDNKEVSKSIRESGEQLTEALDLKMACLEAVVRKGYSVAVVQKAKADHLVGDAKADRGKKRKDKKPLVTTHDASPDLVTLLRLWRAAKAREAGCQAFQVLHQRALLAIAATQPRTLSQLESISGIGPKTVERYGSELLAIVAGFLERGQG